MLRRLSFDLRYRFGRPRWDTGVTPPELVAYVEREGVAPGRALDLGCGTGTNAVYLARHGWDAVGIDFAPRAIALAKRRARDAGVADRTRFLVGDAARLPDLGAPFDLALDIGCLHSIPGERRPGYARGLIARLVPGGIYLLYAFCPPDRFGIARDEVERLLAPLRLVSFVEGTGRASAWYRFTAA
ncbi:MAG TPA: class I SAM-dependent methyltransferase [Candidatus Limnocylindria bacterium]|nr:class I SAM-dependent methyltransferase [Candidatus Limnocylindria bacterium]